MSVYSGKWMDGLLTGFIRLLFFIGFLSAILLGGLIFGIYELIQHLHITWV
jgi:hypothetical protein